MNRKLFLLSLIVLMTLSAGTAAAQGGAGGALTGTLTIVVGDPRDPSAPGAAPVERFFLTPAGGIPVELAIAPADRTPALYRLSGQPVTVQLAPSAAEPFVVERFSAAPGGVHAPGSGESPTAPLPPPVLGNTKWLTIACKFPDRPPEEYPIEYFQEMYRNSFPGLDHYWREVSNGSIDLTGSMALGWYTLPHPYEWYFFLGDNFSLTDTFKDCTAAADPYVYFPDYYGINIVLGNDDLDTAWGGNHETILDGVRHVYPTTWMTRWSLGWVSEFEHEMGHAYGLRYHTYNGLSPYGSAWDVMSRDEYNCERFNDPVYGCYGQHTIARNKKILGWLAPSRIYTAVPGAHTITLERSALPGPTGYLVAEIPIDGDPSHYYTVEARQLVGYDQKLPGAAIIIHEIDEESIYYRRIELVSMGGVGNPEQSLGYDDNVMWLPGETFAAPYGGILVHVDAATPTGFTVTIHNGLASNTVVLTPTGDTYVRGSQPNANFGGLPTLQAEPRDSANFIHTLGAVRFDSTLIPRTTYRVQLRLAILNDGGAAIPGNIRYLDPSYIYTALPWTENGLTWNNTTLGVAPVWESNTRNGSWQEADITWGYGLNDAARVSSLAILGRNTSGPVEFSSKEGANPPQLVIDYWLPPDEPTTLTFLPTNDAYVMSNKKTAVFDKPKLQVRDAAADSNSYLKFNVQGLDGAVTDATLRLWVLDGGPDGGKVYATSAFYKNTTTNWLETGLKWINAPAIGGAPLGSIGAIVPGQWVEVDVTAAVVAATTGANGRVSLALSNDAANLVVYSSGEGVHPPELIVTTE